VTYLKNFIINEQFTQGLASRTLKLSPTSSIKLTTNWDAVNGVEAALHYLITEYGQLGNIIFVFHEKAEKDVTESKPDKAVYTDQITVDPQHLAKILSRFNEVFRIQIDTAQKYIVTCQPGYEFNAATTLKLDKTEEPDFQKMIAKHQAKLNQKQA
jgi:hypothetical protein